MLGFCLQAFICFVFPNSVYYCCTALINTCHVLSPVPMCTMLSTAQISAYTLSCWLLAVRYAHHIFHYTDIRNILLLLLTVPMRSQLQPATIAQEAPPANSWYFSRGSATPLVLVTVFLEWEVYKANSKIERRSLVLLIIQQVQSLPIAAR